MKYKTFQVNSTPEIEKAYEEWASSLRKSSHNGLPESAYSRSMFLKAVVKFWADENIDSSTFFTGHFSRGGGNW